ncbi:MAG: type 11 methyltransferase [Parcubacteria group bacterium Gr01-1014_46]|nr:MAG: type 11 methyltransferase [Parcubacteria group bacterium Gr01-1014_46]
MDIKLHKLHQEVQATHWWFRVKDNLLKDIAKKYFKGATVLDFGCNYGHSVKLLNDWGYNALGVDVSREAISFGKSLKIENIYLDSEKTFPKNHFDAVISLDVLEHIEDDKGALRYLTEVVKPGGYIVIMVPAFMFMWGIQDVISQHYRRYTLSTLTKLANEVGGLEIIRKTYFNTTLFIPIALVRLWARIFPPKSRDSDLNMNNWFLNGLFFIIFDIERRIFKYLNFPFGVSAVIILKKK